MRNKLIPKKSLGGGTSDLLNQGSTNYQMPGASDYSSFGNSAKSM
jgi:hypothetical protein